MSAHPNNRYAAKPDQERASEFLHIRCTVNDKLRWTTKAMLKGQLLSAWIKQALNRASR